MSVQEVRHHHYLARHRASTSGGYRYLLRLAVLRIILGDLREFGR